MNGQESKPKSSGQGRRRKRWPWFAAAAAVVVVVASAGAVVIYRFANTEAVMRAVGQGDAGRLKLLLRVRPGLARAAAAGWTPLHEAVRTDKPDIAAILLDRKADANAPDRDGRTPLQQAVGDGNLAMVQLLLAHGADPNVAARDAAPPLMLAVKAGQADIARALLDCRADANGLGKDRGLPLAVAVNAGRADMLRTLLDHGADPNAPAAGAAAPVILAVESGRADILRLLLDRRAKPNPLGPDGTRLLDRPWPAESAEMLLLLLQHGASSDPANLVGALAMLIQHGHAQAVGDYLKSYPGLARPSKLEASEGGTLLHLAIARNDPQLIDLLLAAGADASAFDAKGRTALDLAVQQRGKPEVVTALLAAKADANAEDLCRALDIALSAGQRDLANAYLAGLPNADGKRDPNKGKGLLHFAVADGSKQTVELLLACGLSVDVTDWEGLTPLHVAVTASRSADEIVAALLARKADPNERDLFERTPLYLAAEAGAGPAVLRRLLDGGAKVESHGEGGETPLVLAAARGDKENVKLLLAYKADPNAQDHQGQTPLHYAALKGDKELAEIMLNGKASTKIRDGSHMLARVYASQKGFQEIADLILRVEAERGELSKPREKGTRRE